MENYVVDRIKGVFFGHAIGDAFGLGTEFLTKDQIKKKYPRGYHNYQHMIQDKHRKRWNPGDWTDDTDQMLAILDSILETGEVNELGVASKIHNWAYNGGKGIGNTVYSTLTSSDYLIQPHEVAKRIWIQSNKNGAANGGVMRTSVLGVWDYLDEAKVISNAELACKVTHYDPRCVGSCVIISMLISRMLKGETSNTTLIALSRGLADKYDKRIFEYIDLSKSLESLKLDEMPFIGYTLKALGCGLWCLSQSNFKIAIRKVVLEGGDADTNASVAGAILGAKLGYSNLPQDWLNGLNKRGLLMEKVDKLLDKMNINLQNQENLKEEGFWERFKSKF